MLCFGFSSSKSEVVTLSHTQYGSNSLATSTFKTHIPLAEGHL